MAIAHQSLPRPPLVDPWALCKSCQTGHHSIEWLYSCRPLLGYLQHRFFPGDFHYHLRPIRDSLTEDSVTVVSEEAFKPDMGVGKMPDGNVSRFSLS